MSLKFFYKTFFVLFLVAMLSTGNVQGSAAAAKSEPAAHRTEVFPISDYPRFLKEAKPVLATGRSDEFTPPEAPSMEASVALRPDASTSRVFISRSYADYARQCAERGEPTRLVVACGRLGHPRKSFKMIGEETYYECEGHSDAYFTINISTDMQPDILGDVFHMPEQAFQPRSWDFIEFEGFSVFFDCYNEQFLRTLANSLRPGGVWILNFDLHFFPSVIKIADRIFDRVGTEFDGSHGSTMRMICREAEKMEDPETAVFANGDDVRTSVNNFFTRLGFKSVVMRNTFLIDRVLARLKSEGKEGTEERVALLEKVVELTSLLTSESVAEAGGGLFGAEIDHLIGPELLPMLKRDLEELALVVRG